LWELEWGEVKQKWCTAAQITAYQWGPKLSRCGGH
jgi:hypothetical protein